MDWLTRLPLVGPHLARLMRTHPWRAYERLEATHWTRLAAAMTFTSFLALFPMIALAAAVGAATLSEDRMGRLEQWMGDQVPGISDRIDIQSFVDNAGAVGSVAALLLLFTGLGWVRALRECLREVWQLPEEEVGFLAGKVKDLLVLVGLGLVGVLSVAGSAFAVSAVDWAVDLLGVESAVVTWLLRITPVLAAVLVDVLLLRYVLTEVPGVRPERGSVWRAALLGAVGFELLKLLLGGYLSGVAAKSMYGAFGIPIALLIWISLMAKLTLFCTAWTATAGPQLARERAEAEAEEAAETAEAARAIEAVEAAGRDAGAEPPSGARPGARPEPGGTEPGEGSDVPEAGKGTASPASYASPTSPAAPASPASSDPDPDPGPAAGASSAGPDPLSPAGSSPDRSRRSGRPGAASDGERRSP
ncbi:YihY/virulence factor BrkB family protein [Streptomyces sp. XM4193]|uniref:YihY/virulence factor BrkB family protein n=1 Tax=Streptomyces sp. XM4193 TaxID=2929782 RepID=UPI001FF85B05|nr:YihY/virulence factor BrkB family protein [Streptomyces sp. XM4193]MCK1795549.1 YihY/virulence factor BrkB family protein [Streptomyces sp. XM4193]